MADHKSKLQELHKQQQKAWERRVPLSIDLCEPEVFWSNVDKSGDCWIWTASTRRYGYGKFHAADGRTISATRYSYFLATGLDPGPLHVLHACDRPCCVNPLHLFLGSAQDNSDDKIQKGRGRFIGQKGADNASAKLTEDDVAAIRSMIAAGHTNVSIAPLFGVSDVAVSKIRRGKAWT